MRFPRENADAALLAASILLATPLPGCETDEVAVTYDVCRPLLESLAGAEGPLAGGFEVTATGTWLALDWEEPRDLAVRVGGVDAAVLDVVREGCDACDACITELTCGECIEACEGRAGYGDAEASECVESVVFAAPAQAAPGSAALAVVTPRGTATGQSVTYRGPCEDGLDDDGDGLVDADDPGCAADPAGSSETGPCEDGLDDDVDGWTDLDDPGCAGDPAGTGEGGFSGTGCNDGLDGDGDGWVDAADPDCIDATLDESPPPAESCEDGLDDDGDGWIDLLDPDCLVPDGSEAGYGAAECNDGVDNDGDGGIDAADADCSEATGTEAA